MIDIEVRVIDNKSMKTYLKYHAPIGVLYIKEEDGFLVGISEDNSALYDYVDVATLKYIPDTIKRTCRYLDHYFAKKALDITIPIHIKGSRFMRTVLEECMKIPYGKTKSYKELAKDVAKILDKEEMSSQAVGTALSKNPIIIYIPCHRVIRSDGTAGDYRLGKKIKKQLLAHEDAMFKED